MKKQIILLMAAACFSMNLKVTSINSPYMVDSVLVLDTLIVEEGGSMFFKSGSGLVITGLLKSQGLSSPNNVFSSGESSPTQFDWSGIIIRPEASAYLKNTKVSDCIECINSLSKNITLDSVTVMNFGQDAVKINDSRLSPISGLFSYHVVEEKPTNKKSRKWLYITGGVALASASIAYFVMFKDDKPTEEKSNPGSHTNSIKYPDLPPN